MSNNYPEIEVFALIHKQTGSICNKIISEYNHNKPELMTDNINAFMMLKQIYNALYAEFLCYGEQIKKQIIDSLLTKHQINLGKNPIEIIIVEGLSIKTKNHYTIGAIRITKTKKSFEIVSDILSINKLANLCQNNSVDFQYHKDSNDAWNIEIQIPSSPEQTMIY